MQGELTNEGKSWRGDIHYFVAMILDQTVQEPTIYAKSIGNFFE